MADDRIDCPSYGVADYTGCTAAGLVINMEGSEVNLVLVLTDSCVAVDPEADTTDRDAERDVECDAERDVELEWGAMRDSFAAVDEAYMRGLKRILLLING